MTADGRGRRCRRRDADRQTLNRQILDGICHSPSHLPPLIFSKLDYHIEHGVSKKLCPFSYPLFPLVLRSECARGLGGRGLSSRVAMAPSPPPSVQRGCLESRERSLSLSLSFLCGSRSAGGDASHFSLAVLLSSPRFSVILRANIAAARRYPRSERAK